MDIGRRAKSTSPHTLQCIDRVIANYMPLGSWLSRGFEESLSLTSHYLDWPLQQFRTGLLRCPLGSARSPRPRSLDIDALGRHLAHKIDLRGWSVECTHGYMRLCVNSSELSSSSYSQPLSSSSHSLGLLLFFSAQGCVGEFPSTPQASSSPNSSPALQPVGRAPGPQVCVSSVRCTESVYGGHSRVSSTTVWVMVHLPIMWQPPDRLQRRGGEELLRALGSFPSRPF